ncbi:MAG: sigma-70 family RNA polymerase sigma factor [Acidobacteriota bacterium]
MPSTHTESPEENPPKSDITELLISWSDGDKESGDQLVPLIYNELRNLASRLLAGERREHTLQPTALVNEAYMRLADLRQIRWQDRAHFFALAARSMRRILVDSARKHRSQKRGGADYKIPMDQIGDLPLENPPDFLALDDALSSLAQIDPNKATIVELRFFGGLSAREIAEVLDCSHSTVNRQWRIAKAWLRCELTSGWQEDT